MNKKPVNIPEILNSFIEVDLPDDKFLVVKETLTRIGVCPKVKKVLYQSCHILSMNGKYYITHFKELFLLDGKESTLDNLDRQRRNQIAKLLQDWGLLKIKNPQMCPVEDHYMKMIKIVSTREKEDWRFIPKYHLGNRNPLNNKKPNFSPRKSINYNY